MADLPGIEAFDGVERLIIIGAHADDAETMCGGTLALLAQRGVRIFLANCTLGDLGSQDPEIARPALAAVRMEETARAAQVLGIEATYNLGHHDGELLPTLELRAQIAGLYRRTGADTLFTFDPFWTGQIHPDHRAAGQAALDAFMPSKMPLYRPEQLAVPGAAVGRLERVFFFSTRRDPDIYVGVTAIYDVKLAASMAHASQFPEGEQSLEWMKTLDREAGDLIGVPFAEAFRQIAVW